ncbi:MAG: hypothetical protein IJR70_08605 [Eubacterium sp.]|nr:hypothetical protein [Eubacterium sp.]
MSSFLTEVLPVKIDRFSNELRLGVRRFYLRKQLKDKYGKHKNAITKEQRKAAKEYWSRYTKHFSPLWHELLTYKTGVFDIKYVPVDIQYTEIETRLNDWQSAHGIDNKNNYSMYFKDVKHPISVFRKTRGIYHADDYSIISKEQAISKCIECGNVIFKVALESGKGGGIFFWKAEEGLGALRDLMEKLPDETNAQEYVQQHEDMARMNPSSCNTIRIVSYANENGIRILRSYFQVGTSEKARMGQVAFGGICVSVHEDGTLYPIGYDVNYDGHKEHPCGIAFDGYKLPSFDKVCEAAIKCHEKMGDFRLISWDFTVGKDGEPIFIEMNIKYGGTMYHQLSSGGFFGERTDEYLNEIYGLRS